MSGKRTLVLIALVAAILRIAPALRDLDAVDRMFVPDDTYYTLAISRSLAHGDGPTVDGQTRTNGFQPLLAFVTVPAFMITNDPDTPLRYGIRLGAFADVLSVLLLARLARRVAGTRGALIAAALWATSPLAIANALGGLETGIALCIQLALVDAWCLAHERRTNARYLITGVLVGTALLARVDSVFLVAALGIMELVIGDRKRLALTTVVAAVIVAPWWGYSLAEFGSPIPESGAAVRDIVAQHRALYLESHMAAGWAAGIVVAAPILDLAWLRESLAGSVAAAWGTWLATTLTTVAVALRWVRRGSSSAVVAMFFVHAVALVCFYTFVVAAVWFFRRYLVSAECAAALIVAAGLTWLWERSRRGALAAGTLVAGCLLFGLVGSARLAVVSPPMSRDTGLHGAKGDRAAAHDVLALAPAGSTIGAFQSGALAYYAPAGVRILNLDGVVDRGAAEAGRAHTLADYARARGMTHLADWRFNLDNFRRLSSASRAGALMKVHVIGHARSQGPRDRFSVLEVSWP